MTRYQLPTGKTVLLTTDQILNMTPEDLQELIANNSGIEVDDPFSDFTYKGTTIEIPDIEIEDLPDDEIHKIEEEFE